jgi:hypothetical protein
VRTQAPGNYPEVCVLTDLLLANYLCFSSP